ncbi:MAG TPA: ABC transporter substrate-binding protein [Candidatus Dormibacteraeota bacterium]|nr:ABC transporter substrate-binding protein [Candidatus Dormibacteraeota bacterium]
MSRSGRVSPSSPAASSCAAPGWAAPPSSAARALGALLEACGPGTPTDAAIFALGTEPEVLSPVVSTLAVESEVMSVIFPGLLELTKDGRGLVPNLAQSYTVSDGGLGHSFTLRPSFKWDDGQPLTSDDRRFTWELYVKEGPRAGATSTPSRPPTTGPSTSASSSRSRRSCSASPASPTRAAARSCPGTPEKDANNLRHAGFSRPERAAVERQGRGPHLQLGPGPPPSASPTAPSPASSAACSTSC